MSTRSLKRKTNTRRGIQRLQAGTRAPHNDGGGEYQSTGESKARAVIEGRAHEDDEQVTAGDDLAKEAVGRVEGNHDGTEGMDRERGIEDDWIWKIAVDVLREGESKVVDGVVFFMIDGEWRQVPYHLWAWKPSMQIRRYQKCILRECAFRFDWWIQDYDEFCPRYNQLVWVPEVWLSTDGSNSC